MAKITKIAVQIKQPGRYSIFVNEQYAFSLSANALLEHKLASGDEMSEADVLRFKKLSADDKMYVMAVRYIAIRPRSRWEITSYLERKDCPAPLIEQITNKLSKFGLLNDVAFAQAFIRDRQLLRPSSRRKIILELRKKHLADEVVQTALAEAELNEAANLHQVINRKRRQTKYQDDQKLMRYLAGQGFNYGDIKTALQTPG